MSRHQHLININDVTMSQAAWVRGAGMSKRERDGALRGRGRC